MKFVNKSNKKKTKILEEAFTITKQNEEILEGYNFKASHNHNVPTPTPMMPVMRTENQPTSWN
jgi:hypothetical protein